MTARPSSSLTSDIVTTLESDGRGNARAYTLDRLQRENPKLFDCVVAGDLSANAAAIKAGFRQKPTPFEKIVKLLPKLSAGEKAKLKRLL